jgi:putative SbcD/Mre11-related phosphoesterase
MKIDKFEIIDRCLFLKEDGVLIVGDLHLGYESSMNERGVAIPRSQMKESFEIFEKIFEKTGKVQKIILLGDVKHFFGKVEKEESNEFVNLVYFLRRFLRRHGEIIIIKGNHDTILEPLVKNHEDIKIVDFFSFEDCLFFHGDKKSFEGKEKRKEKTFVIGHLHPAVSISDGIKKEKYKCFVETKWKKKILIVVPSFFPLIEGSDVFESFNKKELSEGNFFVLGDFDRIFKIKGKSLVSKT